MASFSMISALAVLAAGAQATNSAPPIPENAQIGKFSLDVTCKVFNKLNYTFNALFTATAPIAYGAGQEIYYTDVTGVITIPQALVQVVATPFGAKYASADTEIHLALTNASPADLTVFNGTVNNITIPSSGDAHIRVPSGNSTLPKIGPVTLGEEGVPHRIILGDVSVGLQLLDAHYNNIGSPIPVTCGAQDVTYVIGSVNVDNTTGPAFAPANGFTPQFQPTPALFESGWYRFPYACEFGPLGPQTVDLVIGGSTHIYFNPGEVFNLSYANSFLYVPPSLISLGAQAFPNATDIALDVSEFELTWVNAVPASYNVVGDKGVQTTVSLSAAKDATFNIPIPNDGYLTLGPFTAGDAGTFAAVSVGKSVFTSSLVDSSGNSLFTFNGTCQPSGELELIAIQITDKTVPEYVFGVNTAGSSSSSNTTSNSTSGSFGLSTSVSLPTGVAFPTGVALPTGVSLPTGLSLPSSISPPTGFKLPTYGKSPFSLQRLKLRCSQARL